MSVSASYSVSSLKKLSPGPTLQNGCSLGLSMTGSPSSSLLKNPLLILREPQDDGVGAYLRHSFVSGLGVSINRLLLWSIREDIDEA